MRRKQMRETMMAFLRESIGVGGNNVEDFRTRFKDFLTNNDVPDDIMSEIRKYGAGESFYMAFGVGITDFDAKIERLETGKD